jgi:SNF family Na+-dependent transporter
MQPEKFSLERRAALFVAGGAGVAIVSIPLAAAAGPPYLSFDSLSPWIITYAIGLFAALFAAPFLIRERLRGELESDARWERAMLWWGALAAAVMGASVLCGLPSGFDTDALGGAVGIVGIVVAGLIVGTLLAWVLND